MGNIWSVQKVGLDSYFIKINLYLVINCFQLFKLLLKLVVNSLLENVLYGILGLLFLLLFEKKIII